MTMPFEYMEDYVLMLNGNQEDINTFEELYDLVAGQIRADMRLWGVDETIAEWKEKYPDIKISSNRENAINNIIGYTFGWVKDGLWYDEYYHDDVFNLEFNAYAPDSEFLRAEDRKPLLKRGKPKGFKPLFKRQAKGKPKSASKDLKGYIVRRPDAPNPIPREPGYRPGEMTEPEGTPLLFKYKPELGDISDPKAYVNNLDQNLVDLLWLLCEDENNPKNALREYGQHKFRTRESMIKQFNELSNNAIIVCGNDILSRKWVNMSRRKWLEGYNADREGAPKQEFMWWGGADPYANWKNGKVYSGVIIDDPNQRGNSMEIAYVDSPDQLPRGRVVKEYPLDYDNYMSKRYEESMKREIQNAAPQNERRYRIDRAYVIGEITEDELKGLGIEVGDMELHEKKTVQSRKVYYEVNRSKDTKPKAKTKSPKKKTTTRRK